MELSPASDGTAPALSLDGMSLHRGRQGVVNTVVVAVQGWDQSPAVKAGPESRDMGHGDYAGPQFYASRVITIEGLVQGRNIRDRAQALALVDRAAGLAPVLMTVTSAGTTTSAMVIRSSFEPDPMDPRSLTTRYSLTVKATDPFRYGGWQAPVFLGSDVRTEGIFHRGNADSPPVLRVSGSAPGGYTITHEDGQGFEVHAPLVSGRPHIVDFATVRAYDNGVPVSDYGQAKQILIHRGMPQAMRIRPNATGSVTAELEVQDVWI